MMKLLRHEKHLFTLVKVAVLKAATERWYRLPLSHGLVKCRVKYLGDISKLFCDNFDFFK